MAGMGAGYDLSVSTFSPDGRVFQVEYATKAVDNSGTAMGIVCKDGIVLAVEKFVLSPMIIPGTSPRIFPVDSHVSIAIAGFIADAREVVNRARLEASEYKRVYGSRIPGKILASHLALFMHAYTLAWSERPFATGLVVAVRNESKKAQSGRFELYAIDTAGVCYRYFGTAIGKGRQIVKTEIEKLKTQELTCQEAFVQVAKLMRQAHDETREREMELEIAVLTAERDIGHRMLPRDEVKMLEEAAQKLLEEEEKAKEDADAKSDTSMRD